jgi:hypothetical protein
LTALAWIGPEQITTGEDECRSTVNATPLLGVTPAKVVTASSRPLQGPVPAVDAVTARRMCALAAVDESKRSTTAMLSIFTGGAGVCELPAEGGGGAGRRQ